MRLTFLQTLFATLVVAICGIGLVFMNSLSFPDARFNFLGESKHAELTSGAPITQVIPIEHDRLGGFQIFMGDTELAFGERIDFMLLDASCHKVFERDNRTFYSLPTTRDILFTFDPIPDSTGQAYCLSIEYRDGLMKRKERPYIRVTENEDFQASAYTDSGKGKTYAGRTLQIRPLYAPTTLVARFGELENRLSQYKPVFAKGSVLMIGIAGILLGLLFFCSLFKRLD